MSLYHSQAFGLPRVRLAPLTGLTLTRHADEQRTRRRINPPFDLTTFDLSLWRAFEVETDGFMAVKVAARRRYNHFLDLIVVVRIPERRILTLYLNEARDPHLTLDRERYDRPLPASEFIGIPA